MLGLIITWILSVLAANKINKLFFVVLTALPIGVFGAVCEIAISTAMLINSNGGSLKDIHVGKTAVLLITKTIIYALIALIITLLQRYLNHKKSKIIMPETDQLLLKIDDINKKIPDNFSDISGPLLAQLTTTIRTRWSLKDQHNYASQLRNGETHEAFIYNFVVHSLADALESGNFHVYRGVLNVEGQRRKALFEYAIDAMITMGGYTKAWADINLRSPIYKSLDGIG